MKGSSEEFVGEFLLSSIPDETIGFLSEESNWR